MAFVYATFDPSLTNYFPACPFYSLSGLLCPGCGSQRALHHLLNLQIQAAYSYNPLLVLSLPYVLAGAVYDRIPINAPQLEKIRQLFYGRKAILLVLIIIISFWIFRNL